MNGKGFTEKRWQESSDNFCEKVKVSIFNQEETRVWKNIIYQNAPNKEKLKILDIGTGPGFFSIILSQDGHDVTGIDCTPGMLDGARKNADAVGVKPRFLAMDCHELEFEENTFDLIVTRNVTWTLYDPVKAYMEWKRVLRPGARMLIFDANWYMHFFDNNIKKNFDAGVLEYREKYGKFPEGFSMYLIEDYWLKLPLVGIKRPDWDQATLWKMGFVNMKFDRDIDDKVYTQEKSRLLYGSTPMFMISADKPEAEEATLDFLNRYWSSVSLEWSNACLKENQSPIKASYKELFRPYLKKDKMRVLDIGTGSGFIASVFAEEGHEVTGIDISEDMLTQAKYCTDILGLEVKLLQANTNNLPFENESFDLVVCRNVTWIFQDPDKAFSEWNRVLTEGGRILYIDANWNLYMHDENEMEKFSENRRKAIEMGEKKLYGNGHSSTVLIDKLSFDRPFSKIRRPDWDRNNLQRFGFKTIEIRENITKEICNEIESLRTEATPMFLVCAEKQYPLL